MVDPGPHNTDQLPGNVDRLRRSTLVVPPVLLLCAAFHLRHIVGRQGQPLEAATSSDGPQGDEVIERKRIHGTERAAWTLHGLVDGFGQRVGRIGIIVGGTGVLDVVLRLELLEPLRPGIVDILRVGDKGRRRSTRSRHFEWRTG